MAPKNSAKSCGFVETEEGENGKCSFILTLDSDGHMEISPHNVKEEQQQQKPQSESQPERICSGVCSKEIKTEPSTSNKRRISIAILKHDPAEEGVVAEGVAKGVLGGETHDIVSIGGIQGAGAALPRFVKIYNKDLGSKPSFVVLEDAVVRKRIEENLQPATCHCNAQQQTSPCDIGAHTSSQTDEYLLEYAVRPQLVKRPAQRVQQRQRSGAGIVESTGSPHVTISFIPPTAGGNNNHNNLNNMVYPSSSHSSCSTCSSCSCCACSNHCCFLQPSGVLPTPEPQAMGYYPHSLPMIGSHCSHMTLPTAAAAAATLTQQQYPLNNWYPSHSHQCLYYHPASTMNMTSGCPSPHCGATCCMHGHGQHSHGHCGKCFNQQQQPQPQQHQQQQQQQQHNYPPTFGRSKRAKQNSCGESTEHSEKVNVPPQENVVPLPTSFLDSSTMNPSETLQTLDTVRSIAGAADICSGEKCSTATTSMCMARFGRTCLILRPTTPTPIPRLLTKRISRYTSVMAWPSGNKMIQQKPPAIATQGKVEAKEVTHIN